MINNMVGTICNFKTAIGVSVMLILSACNSKDSEQIDPITHVLDVEPQIVMVKLDAIQEIPEPFGVPANAEGVAELSVHASGVVNATLKVSNLTGPASMVHIHRGSVGENGPVLIGLTTEDGGSTWTTAADAPVLSVDEIEAFKNGELYFNVHTMVNTPGELRGQIDPENALILAGEVGTTSVSASLNANQKIPAFW